MKKANKFFDEIDIPVDTGPANHIPAGARIICGIDLSSSNGDSGAIVRGYAKDGVFVIQEVEYLNPEKIDEHQ